MRVPIDDRKLAQMVKETLKSKNPRMYRELARKGELERFAAERVQLIREAGNQLRPEAALEARAQAEKEGKTGYQEVALINTALHQVDEYLLAIFPEFPTTQPSLEL
ncbi:MAG: hypothetical protein M1438_11880 [Deltaproteobacteria bacterium]|nr:hypothetical protein [Deltaproteobacteria bacterium]